MRPCQRSQTKQVIMFSDSFVTENCLHKIPESYFSLMTIDVQPKK